MIKKLSINIFGILLFLSSVNTAQPEFSKLNSMAGAFSRMGFGARGIAMGNSISALDEGNMVSYYNPALSAFQEKNYFQTSYSFLSLDRSLNFLNFTRKLEFGKNKSSDGKPRSIAGISFGLINAGVSNIDARGSQGEKLKDLSTSENQFFLNFSNRFSEKLSLGIGLKLFYYKLYEDITSSGFGFDIGALYKFNDKLNFGIVLADINSKYKWDTSGLYGTDGNSTFNEFPFLVKISSAYKFNDPKLVATIEYEHSNAETDFIRLGTEYNIYENLFLRGGIDRISVSNFDIPMKPALGFSYSQMINEILISVNYAYSIEPYSSYDHHIIGLDILF